MDNLPPCHLTHYSLDHFGDGFTGLLTQPTVKALKEVGHQDYALPIHCVNSRHLPLSTA